jgi:hypothetical protein
MTKKPEQTDSPVVVVPSGILIASVAWLLVLIGSFICFERSDAFADFVEFDLGPLPFESIWFGAVGGWLISAQGIFDHNREWECKFDFWHYLRPVLGALMGTLGCLIFIVLNEAATTESVTPNPTFYDVVALTIGYREASFRQLIGKLLDTVIGPGEKKPTAK